ncbi:MAG: hypothetical protein AYK19_14195 [Theionarchaea archaeon DG-70-1]|nr:MAG: hypothetical protein AYK19_14195 [Theionarchaea archaeon DG-70-1]
MEVINITNPRIRPEPDKIPDIKPPIPPQPPSGAITIQIPNFPPTWYMTWDMYTMAAYKICVTLKDSSKTYVNNACQASTNPEPPLARGRDKIAGNNLQIAFDIPQAKHIIYYIHQYTIPRLNGKPAGHGFVLGVEDWTDADYNDLFVSMVCWEHPF